MHIYKCCEVFYVTHQWLKDGLKNVKKAKSKFSTFLSYNTLITFKVMVKIDCRNINCVKNFETSLKLD